jgi:hypothetical protein
MHSNKKRMMNDIFDVMKWKILMKMLDQLFRAALPSGGGDSTDGEHAFAGFLIKGNGCNKQSRSQAGP